MAEVQAEADHGDARRSRLWLISNATVALAALVLLGPAGMGVVAAAVMVTGVSVGWRSATTRRVILVDVVVAAVFLVWWVVAAAATAQRA